MSKYATFCDLPPRVQRALENIARVDHWSGERLSMPIPALHMKSILEVLNSESAEAELEIVAYCRAVKSRFG